jgi:hypothetical protein
MKDMNFDLVEELGKKLSGVVRMKQYHKDATEHSCDACGAMWQKLVKMDEEAAELIRAELVNHVQQNNFE